MTMPLPALPSLTPTMGATFVGSMVAAILYGSANVQTYMYFRNYPHDWIFQKYAVAALWVLDSLHMAFTMAEMWHYLIDSFGNYLALLSITWSVKVQIAINVIIILVVQSLYTVRVWKLSANHTKIWAYTLIVVLLAGYATGIILVIETSTISYIAQISQISWVIYLSFAIPTVNDFALAVGICHLISLRRTTFAETQSRLLIVMRYTFISGTLTSICSLAALITYAAMPNSLVFLGIEFLLTKLYINSYLAMLNARKSMRDQSTSHSTTNVMQLSHLESRQPSNHRDLDFRRRSRASVDELHTKISGHPANMDSRPVRIRVDVVRDDRVLSDDDYIGISDILRSVSPRTPVFDEKGDEFMEKEQSG